MSDSIIVYSETKVRRKLNFKSNMTKQLINFNNTIQEKRKYSELNEIPNYLSFKSHKRQKCHSVNSSFERAVIF